MTTETEKAPGAAPADDEEQSFLPTVLAGAGILAVAALLIFWPSDDDEKGQKGADRGKAAAAARDSAGSRSGAKGAGVGARPTDAATAPASRRRNPAIKLPETKGMAPTMPDPPPTDPPESATTDEKIAFYEKRLEQAQLNLENRTKFLERLPKMKASIEQSDNPAQGMETYKRREKIVQDNYDSAKKQVEEIEAKLAALR